VRLGLAVLGVGVLGLRLGSLLCGTAAIIVAYLLARDLYGARVGVWAAALLASCPLVFALGTVTTPDAFLLPLWLVFMWTLWRAANGWGTFWWLAAGVVLAAGLYAKHIMALAVPCALLALCASPRGRATLGRPCPWVALGVGMACFLPVFVAWNWQHGWATLRFHLAARHDWSFSLKTCARYVLGHAGALSPVLYVGVLASLVAAGRAWWRSGPGRNEEGGDGVGWAGPRWPRRCSCWR